MRTSLIFWVVLFIGVASVGLPRDSVGASLAQCPQSTPEAEVWLDYLNPLFTGVAYDSTRQSIGLSVVSQSEQIAVVTDSTTCAEIADAVDEKISDIAHWQSNPYELRIVQFGPYYAVAVEEPRVDSTGLAHGRRTLVLVLEAATLSFIETGLMF